MIITKEYVRSVRPEVPEKPDKYSWNLYLYLKRNRNENIRAYKDKRGETIVGHECDGGSRGMNVLSILWDDKAQEYSLGIYGELKEVPKYFEKYQRIGRCLMISHDQPWVPGGEHRFTVVNNTRRCNWCGKWQHKKIHKKTVVVREDKWEDDNEDHVNRLEKELRECLK